MRTWIRTYALGAALASLAMVSNSALVAAEENPCKADVIKFCGQVQPGQGRLNACLQEHKDEMSKECRDWMARKSSEVKGRLERMQQACSADIAKFCKGIEQGEGRILGCLMKHKDALSQECKVSMGEKAAQARTRMDAMHKACDGDIARLCKGIEQGEGRTLGCLMKNKDALSQECKASLARK